jgi:plasmid stabilization system protein ParE
MRRSVSFHPAAVDDTDGAASWYAQRSPHTAERFLDELDHLIELIASDPDRFPQLTSDLRRTLFRRFTYYIVFRATDKSVEVIAVAHGKRRPRFWQPRIRG